MAQEILVNINVNSGAAEVKVNQLNKATKDLSKTFIVNQKALASQKGEAKLASIEQKRLSYEMQNAGKIAATYETATNKATKGTKQFRTQVGLNNAILQEAGRAASDLRFGFNGVANNVGQLASLFGALINTSDNVVTSFKNLGKSLLGTGGILIAVQLLIAYADRIYAFFSGVSVSAQKTKKAFDDLEKSVQGQREELIGYVEVLRTAEIAEETRYNALKELEEVVPNLTKNNNDQKISLEELTLEVEEYIKQQRLRAQLDALISSNGELFAEREKVRRIQSRLDAAKSQEEQEQIYKSNASFLETLGLITEEIAIALATPIEKQDGKFNYADFFRDQNKDLVEEYDSIISQIVGIEKKLKRDRDDEERETGKLRVDFDRQTTFRLYKTREKEFDKYAENALRKELSLIERTEIQKLDLEKQFKIRSLRAEADRALEAESIKFKEYLKDISLRKDNLIQRVNEKKEELLLEAETEAEKEEIRKKSNSKIVQINSEFRKALLIADERYVNFLTKTKSSFEENAQAIIDSYGRIQDELVEQQELDDVSKFAQLAIDGIQNRIKAEMKLSRSVFDRIDLEKELEKSRHDEKMGQLQAELDLAESNGESTLAIQQKITNEEQNYSNTKTGIAQKERDAKVALINEVSDVFLMAAKEGSVIAKAVAMFAATVNTYEAVTAALGAKPYTPLNILQAAAVGAKGFLQVREIANTPAPLGGGSSSSAPVQAPAFNVVGASATNQLAQAVGNNVPQVLPVAFESDLSDALDVNDSNTGADTVGQRSIG